MDMINQMLCTRSLFLPLRGESYCLSLSLFAWYFQFSRSLSLLLLLEQTIFSQLFAAAGEFTPHVQHCAPNVVLQQKQWEPNNTSAHAPILARFLPHKSYLGHCHTDWLFLLFALFSLCCLTLSGLLSPCSLINSQCHGMRPYFFVTYCSVFLISCLRVSVTWSFFP